MGRKICDGKCGHQRCIKAKNRKRAKIERMNNPGMKLTSNYRRRRSRDRVVRAPVYCGTCYRKDCTCGERRVSFRRAAPVNW